MQKSKKFLVKASPMPDKASKDSEKIKAFRLPKISAISPKKNIHKWKQKNFSAKLFDLPTYVNLEAKKIDRKK